MNLTSFLPYCCLTSCSLSHFFAGLSFRVLKKKDFLKYILKYFWLDCMLDYLECGPNPCFIPLLQSSFCLEGIQVRGIKIKKYLCSILSSSSFFCCSIMLNFMRIMFLALWNSPLRVFSLKDSPSPKLEE